MNIAGGNNRLIVHLAQLNDSLVDFQYIFFRIDFPVIAFLTKNQELIIIDWLYFKLIIKINQPFNLLV